MCRILFFFLLFFSSVSWSACRPFSAYGTGLQNGCQSLFDSSPNVFCTGYEKCCGDVGGSVSVCNLAYYSQCIEGGRYSCGEYYSECVRCDTQTETDSLACLHAGNQWIDGHCCDAKCVCEKDGHQWNESTQSCESCNDHVDVPDKCVEVWKNGYTTDADGNPGGGGYWAIETYECYYDSCAMSLNCQGPKNSFPAGNLTCDDFQDTTLNKKCVGVVGHRCTIQCPNNTTINCDCDGSCVVAQTAKGCQCPINSSSSTPSSSSSGDGSSSSGDNSSSSVQSSSSADGPNSSDSPVSSGANGDWEYNYSGVLNQIEYNTRQTNYNTNSAVGYLNSIDKWQSTINYNLQSESSKIQSAIASGATQVATAENATTEKLGETNEILSNIRGSLGSLDSNVNVPDISGWLDSANSSIDKLKNPDTTFLNPDSLKNDTTQFKSKYSSMFLTGVYTRNGCYEFKMTKPAQTSKFGRFFKNDIVVDFGDVAGSFDLCAILRGLVRIAGAILVLLISIKSYRSAFSSGSGD